MQGKGKTQGQDTGTRHGQSFMGLCRNTYIILHDENLISLVKKKTYADLPHLDEVFAVQNYNTFQLQFTFQFVKAKGFLANSSRILLRSN